LLAVNNLFASTSLQHIKACIRATNKYTEQVPNCGTDRICNMSLKCITKNSNLLTQENRKYIDYKGPI